MVASEILKNRFVPGKGLGADLQGIVQLVYLPKNLDTFGLGFKPTAADRLQSIELKHIPRIHNEVADALATLASMLHHPDKAYMDPLQIQVRDQHAYCNVVEEELDGEAWFNDIKKYIRMGVYPIQATGDQKRTIRRLASGFFLTGGVLYKRTPDLGLLRCIDARHATYIMTEVHFGFCGPHMSGYVLAKKILRAAYYWLTMERDCISFVRKCHQC
ncbi:uncharacterized protein [Nicotiana sylvestris]|uniref:uncharacterized protein n=1 Tax=Nicotiana sylvestris TaxID=4096 RepID=UPI00388CB235